jgi:hypothetical protein
MSTGWCIRKNGEILVRGLPGPTYASIAFSNYCCLQEEPCEMSVTDPQGNVIASIDLDENQVLGDSETAKKLEKAREVIDKAQAAAEEENERRAADLGVKLAEPPEPEPKPAKAKAKAKKKRLPRPEK